MVKDILTEMQGKIDRESSYCTSQPTKRGRNNCIGTSLILIEEKYKELKQNVQTDKQLIDLMSVYTKGIERMSKNVE